MTYDEFREKLLKIKHEYTKETNRELESIQDLEKYLDRRLAKPKSRGAKSLRGLSL